jgi:hypothetical protein
MLLQIYAADVMSFGLVCAIIYVLTRYLCRCMRTRQANAYALCNVELRYAERLHACTMVEGS